QRTGRPGRGPAHSCLTEWRQKRPAPVKGTATARAKRTLAGEDRSAKIPREGMASSQDLHKRGAFLQCVLTPVYAINMVFGYEIIDECATTQFLASEWGTQVASTVLS